MKVFVTGGNGFIGSRVVSRLVGKGYDVRCLLRKTSRTSRIDHLTVERYFGDIRSAESLKSGMEGCGAVVHLASISSWEHIRSKLVPETIIDGTINVLDAGRAAGNLKTVFVSSSTAVNGTDGPVVCDEAADFRLDPKKFIYAAAKHEAERKAAEYVRKGLPVVIVNPCEVYGPDDDDMVTASNLRDFIKDWPALAVTGGIAVSHVDDIADGIVAALERGRSGERYILGGENITVRQLIDITLEAAGQKKPVLHLPNGVVKFLIKGLHALHLPTPVIPDIVDYATLFWWVDCSKAERELGYSYRPAKAVIGDAVRWLKETKRVP
ncbi:MAG TPA: NAD-dependent epimerase/dehydratase family protein [bacterium]|nr:NAD-dependent epimerase/dehydratase family protein [bacterium]